MASVTIAQGKLKGCEAISENGTKFYDFLSVPYAKPPVGDLRFKSPQSPESWKGERDATKSAVENTSCQLNMVSGQITGTEDCLYLNVYTPNLPSSGSKPLPVMFYVHGGGFIYGNGIIKEELNPELLVESGVVVVTINYRIGVFGFLSLDIPEASGNMGLKDQVKALEWVQKNIDKFGGDKDNVTIFGNSAGSASVEYLLLSPTTKGLFHKAILLSGSSINDWAMCFQYEQLTLNLADKLGYTGDTKNKRSLYEFLLKVPAAELTAAAFSVTDNFTANSIFFGFVPTVEKIEEGAFITTHPFKLLKEGKFAKVPVVRGFCNLEGSIMNMLKPLAVNELAEEKSFMKYWSYEVDKDDKEKYDNNFRKAYMEPATPEEDHDKFAVDFFGDLHFSAGIWLAANFFARHDVPQYVYQFCYDGKMNIFKKLARLMKKGAAHGDDFGYVFKTSLLTEQPEDSDIELKNKMTKMWSNFAKTGNPAPQGSDINLKWPKFTEQTKTYLNINKEFIIEDNYEADKMAVFEEIYGKYEK